MSNEAYDVAIVGAGPAGATAAILLAQKGHRVVLVDQASFPRESTRAGWLNTRSAELLDRLSVKERALDKYAFHNVFFYRADFSQTVQPHLSDIPGYLIDRTQFDNVLVATAGAQGVKLLTGQAAVDLELRESSVIVHLADAKTVQGKLLFLASGQDTGLLERVGLAADPGESPMWTAQVDAELPKDLRPAEPSVGVVLGLDNRGSFGLCCLAPQRMSVAVNWLGPRDEAHSLLVALCQNACAHKAVPLDLAQDAGSAKLVRSPASAALDRETHVGKHTLVIGDAGGFVSAASNEGIFPAMWSADIAADVADRALHSVHSQDELMTFNSTWRMAMADYLRSPHTDIQFLLPLIFTNQPMADRMAAAFFKGENI